MATAVAYLRWCDVDPRRHDFDAGEARSIAERHVLWGVDGDAGRTAPVLGRKRDDIEARIDRELIGAFGAWVAGWRWAASEPGGGGPVRGWCCAGDSVFRKGDRSATDSIERVVAAVMEWRAFLVELAERFDVLREETASRRDAEVVERVAARLLPVVVERTGAEDAWYATFAQVLSWYLEAAGLEDDAVREAVNTVVSGRFESWIAPGEALAASVSAELGRAVQGAAGDAGKSVDALAGWLAIRSKLLASPRSLVPEAPVRLDGHRRFIDGPERRRDPERAARMTLALDACRLSASRDEPLTFERLAAWQAFALGEPSVAFRTMDAYAKRGRERYVLRSDTRVRFDAALAEASDSTVACVVRAARAYLDVCFFHPFADGNARAARLALDHVLTRGGLGLHGAEPLFVVARSSLDPGGAMSFVYVVDYLSGPIAGQQ